MSDILKVPPRYLKHHTLHRTISRFGDDLTNPDLKADLNSPHWIQVAKSISPYCAEYR